MDKSSIQKKLSQTLDSIDALIKKAKNNGLDQVEVFAAYGIGEEVTLEKNDVSNATALEEMNFGIRVIQDGCQGFVTTNTIESVWESILDAKALAKSQTTPDSSLFLPNPRELIKPFDFYDPSLDQVSMEDLILVAKTTLDWKRDLFPKLSLDSGGFSLSKRFHLVASTKGVLAYELDGGVSGSIMGMAVDGSQVGSFDYDGESGLTLSAFLDKWKIMLPEFGEQCMSSLQARTTKSFNGYIILPPESVYSFFLGNFIGALNASSLRKGKSKMQGKLETQVASPLLSIWDDPHAPNFSGSTSFDREGQPTQKQEILTNGILKNYYYNTYEAAKAGLLHSNGFASGGSGSLPGCGPKQLQIAPGTSDSSEFFTLDKPALFINRLSGTQEGSSGDFSGVVKGGFLYENGEKIPVKEVQVVGNAYDALHQIAGISKQGELLSDSVWVPYILLEGFTVTGTVED